MQSLNSFSRIVLTSGNLIVFMPLFANVFPFNEVILFSSKFSNDVHKRKADVPSVCTEGIETSDNSEQLEKADCPIVVAFSSVTDFNFSHLQNVKEPILDTSGKLTAVKPLFSKAWLSMPVTAGKLAVSN